MLTLEQLAKIFAKNPSLLKLFVKSSNGITTTADLQFLINQLLSNHLKTLSQNLNITHNAVLTIGPCTTTRVGSIYICSGLPSSLSLSLYERSDSQSAYFILRNNDMESLRYRYQNFIGDALKLLFHLHHWATPNDKDIIFNKCKLILERQNLKNEAHRIDPSFYDGEIKEVHWQNVKMGNVTEIIRQVQEEICRETEFIHRIVSLIQNEISAIITQNYRDHNVLTSLCTALFANSVQMLDDADKTIPAEIFFSQFSYITPSPILISNSMKIDVIINEYQQWVERNIQMIQEVITSLSTQARAFNTHPENSLPGYTRYTEVNPDSNRVYLNNCWRLSDIIGRLKKDFNNSLIPISVQELERVESEYDTMLGQNPNFPRASCSRGYGKLVINNNPYASDYMDIKHLYNSLLAKQNELLNILRNMVIQQAKLNAQLTTECKNFAETVVRENIDEISASTQKIDDILNHIDFLSSDIKGILNKDILNKLRSLVIKKADEICTAQEKAALKNVFDTLDPQDIRRYDDQFNKILNSQSFEKLKRMIRNDFAGRVAMDKVEQSLDPTLLNQYNAGLLRLINTDTYGKLRSLMKQIYNKTYPKVNESELPQQTQNIIEKSVKECTVEQLRHFCHDFVGSAEDNNKDGGDKQKEFTLKITPAMLIEAKENLRHTTTRATLAFTPNSPAQNASLDDLQKRIQNLRRVSTQLDGSFKNIEPDERLVKAREKLRISDQPTNHVDARRKTVVAPNNEELSPTRLKPVGSKSSDIKLPLAVREREPVAPPRLSSLSVTHSPYKSAAAMEPASKNTATLASYTPNSKPSAAAVLPKASSADSLQPPTLFTRNSSTLDKGNVDKSNNTNGATNKSPVFLAAQPFLSSPLHSPHKPGNNQTTQPHNGSTPPPPPPRSPESLRPPLINGSRHNFKVLNIEFDKVFNHQCKSYDELVETLSYISIFHQQLIDDMTHEPHEPRALEIYKCFKVLVLHSFYQNNDTIITIAKNYVESFIKLFHRFETFVDLLSSSEDLFTLVNEGNQIIKELKEHYINYNDFVETCLGPFALANIRNYFMDQIETLLNSDIEAIVSNVLLHSDLLDLVKDTVPAPGQAIEPINHAMRI